MFLLTEALGKKKIHKIDRLAGWFIDVYQCSWMANRACVTLYVISRAGDSQGTGHPRWRSTATREKVGTQSHFQTQWRWAEAPSPHKGGEKTGLLGFFRLKDTNL